MGSAGRRERQLVDDDAAQRLADDVDPLPEACGGEEHSVRRFFKLPKQLRARYRSLRENRVVQCHLGEGLNLA